MNILVAGCGYIGLPLGTRLKSQGHDVTGWVVSDHSAHQVSAAGLGLIQADLTQTEPWEKVRQTFDTIVYCPSTRGGAPEDYRRIYVDGMRNALAGLKKGGRFIYTAATSVYGQNDGSQVDETAETKPGTESGKLLLEAESVALSVQGTILRLSAIYGPTRGVMLKRFLEASGPIAGDPDRYLNQIHREDAVSATAFALDLEKTRGEILNVSDNEPATHRGIYQWLAETTGKPVPEFSGESAPRKRGDSNRRISNAKLRGLGWDPKYPSFREGYRLELKANADG